MPDADLSKWITPEIADAISFYLAINTFLVQLQADLLPSFVFAKI